MVAVVPEAMRRFTRAEFHRMDAEGLFVGERLELFRGVVVAMSPIKPRHAHSVDCLARILFAAIGERGWVRVQQPLAADDTSEPQPDLAVIANEAYGRDDHPAAACLVIEVSDTSRRYDLGDKAQLYAECAVDEYWVVDLVNDVVVVHRDRDGRAWGSITEHRAGEALRLVAFPDIAVDVARALVLD